MGHTGTGPHGTSNDSSVETYSVIIDHLRAKDAVQQAEIERLREVLRRWRDVTFVSGAHRTCNCKACDALIHECVEVDNRRQLSGGD
jgi:hypothetical protein